MRESGRIAYVVLFLFTALCFAETNWNLQAVDEYGVGTHPSIADGYKVTIEGYILNRPEYMLNGEPNYNEISGDLGGQWQIFIQGEAGDHAGTAVWMGQCYRNLGPWATGRYTDEQWLAELDRLNHDPCTGRRFMPGDKVRVIGKTKFYGGKTNINERHSTDPNNDVTIELVQIGAGLPEPEVITLDMVKDVNDNFIFDYTRLTGGEYYQGRLVRINNVSFVDANLWAPDARTLLITDGTRTLPLWLGIGPGITVGSNNLPVQFDVIGIFNQENSNTGGYQIWVTNYDGNGQILTDGCDLFGVFADGDVNKDCIVDFEDFAIMAADWLKCTNPLLPDCQ